MRSPGSTNDLPINSSASIAPLVISSSSSAGRRPCSLWIRPARASKGPARPRVGAYWNALASPVATNSWKSVETRSRGNVSGSGKPPANEITSGMPSSARTDAIPSPTSARVRAASSASQRRVSGVTLKPPILDWSGSSAGNSPKGDRAGAARGWSGNARRGAPVPCAGRRAGGFTGRLFVGVKHTSSGADRALRLLAEEQAALRRVATLVASAPEPKDVFHAVAEEAGRLLGAQTPVTGRFEDEGGVVVGLWDEGGGASFDVGTLVPYSDPDVPVYVASQHGGRIDDYTDVPGEAARMTRAAGYLSSVV